MIKKRMIITILFLSLFVCGLQMAAPVFAAKLIDHGSLDYGWGKTTWKTYQYNKNYVVIKIKDYVDYKLQDTAKITIKKISSNKLKYVYEKYSKSKNEDGLMDYFYDRDTYYIKYSSNARKYYYHQIRPVLLGKY